MDDAKLPDKSYGENSFSITTIHYKVLEYKWKIQNVSYMSYSVKSPIFPADGGIQCLIQFSYKNNFHNYELLIWFKLEKCLSIMAMPSMQILSGKRLSKTETHLIEVGHNFSWGFPIIENLADLIDSDDSLTVHCRIKISREKATTDILNLPPCNLANDLESVMSSGYLSDLTLVCSDRKELKAHRAVLAARSPVFAAMFRHSMKEAKSGRVEVSDVEAEVMEALLSFVYTDKIPSVVSKLGYKLLAAADKYDLARLRSACEQRIMENVNIDNACVALVATEQYHLSGLKQRVLRFMKANIHSVINTEGWVVVASNCPQAVSELFSIE